MAEISGKRKEDIKQEIHRELIYFFLHGVMGILVLICCIFQFKDKPGAESFLWFKLSLLPLALAYFISIYRYKDYKNFPNLRVNFLKFFWLLICLLIFIEGVHMGLGNLITFLHQAKGVDWPVLVYLKNLYFYFFLILFFFIESGFTLALSSPLTIDEKGHLTIHPAYKKDV